jgi:hypothetical protein
MDTEPRPKRRIPFSVVLVLGVLLVCMGTFLFLNFAPIYPYNSWIPLQGPPFGVAHLVGFAVWTWDDGLGKIGVEANDGTYYTTKIFCLVMTDSGPYLCPDTNLPDWPHWVPVKAAPRIVDVSSTLPIRGNNCAGLQNGLAPLDPAGVRECIYATLHCETCFTNFYIALTADGSLKIWQNRADIFLLVVYGLFSAVSALLAAVLISIIRSIVNLVRRGSVRDQGASPTPG